MALVVVNSNGNIFNNASTTVGQEGGTVCLNNYLGNTVTVLGTSTVAGNLKLSYSLDGTNFIDNVKTIAIPVGGFESTFEVAVGYIKFTVDVATTITATLAQNNFKRN